MWNNYNNQQNPGGSPPPFPPGYSNPTNSAQSGYHPGYAPSYAPGPPDSYGATPGGYPPPSGPPPSGPPPSEFHPTPRYGPPPGPPPSGYPPPPGPPKGYGPPHAGYRPPPGPPPNMGYPGQQYHQQHSSGYPGQQQHYNGPPPNYTPSGPPPRPPADVQHYGPQFQDANNRQAQPWFQYSQCSGKKKGLFIGINYFGQEAELHGCINDVRNIQDFLIRQFGYKREDMVTLTDDQKNPRGIPTRDNMIQAIHWLVRGAQPNDSLFFHYSGHGGQTKDLDGDEDDGYDEVIYPVDFQTAGHIVDDELHDILIKTLPPGCRLTAIMDCCHSGSALDLPYTYSTDGKIKEPNLAAEAGQGLLQAVTAYARGDMSQVFQSAMGLVKTATGQSQKADKFAKATKTSPADCISFGGCKDDQTSADTEEAGKATGAMSFAFIAALTAKPHQSYQELLVNIRDILRSKYSQKPQLSSSHPMVNYAVAKNSVKDADSFTGH